MFFFSDITAIYIVAALLPAVLLLRYVYKQDKIEKEPPGLLALLLLGGVLAVLLSIALEIAGQGLLDYQFYYATMTYYILLALMVALVEEGSKLLFLRLFSWNNPNFNYVFDAVVYSVFVSLGFAAFENVKYVFTYGLATALTRAVTAIPGHLSFSVFMGVFYGRAKLCSVYGSLSGTKSNLITGYLTAVFFHGFYDACAMIGGTVASIVFIIFIICMYIIVFRLIKAASRHDRPLV